jgi:hypothetical protein
MLVTILGSCRQVPLSRYFKTSCIQEDLTYPHYSKEIIQAMDFCSGKSTIPTELTRYIFRYGLLHRTTLSHMPLMEDFANTDIFVIEIASRLCYEYKGYYAHHIAYDNTGYRIADHARINKRELSDAEIEADLLRIKQLVGSKKLLIVPHIYTRKSGKRYDLILLLKSLCEKYDIPFLDVSHEIENLEVDLSKIYLSESVLAHFTDYGNSVVSEIYLNKITKLI